MLILHIFQIEINSNNINKNILHNELINILILFKKKKKNCSLIIYFSKKNLRYYQSKFKMIHTLFYKTCMYIKLMY